MQKLKIGIVSDVYLPRIGGLELHLRDLARELNARGHEAHIICATPGPADYGDGVHVHRLELPLLPFFHVVRSPSCLAALERLFAAERYDVIHAHAAFLPMAHASIYLARRLGIPSVFTECSWLGGAWHTVFRTLHQVTGWGSWPTLISGVSRFVAASLAQITGREDVFVLHNGVRVADWRTERHEPAPPCITSVMRFTYRKRPFDLVRALPRIHARLPAHLRPRLVLVGDGAQRSRVRFEARRLGVADHLELPGFLDRREIRRIFSRTTLFALPTRREAMSIVCVEALAAGLPVVAMNLGGVSDVVEHGREGLLANDEHEFVDHLVALLRDDELRHRMAQSAPGRVHRFAWDTVIARHLNVFRLAIQRTRGEPELPLDRLGLCAAPGYGPGAASASGA